MKRSVGAAARTAMPVLCAVLWIILGICWSSVPRHLDIATLPSGVKGSVGSWYRGSLQAGPWMVSTGVLFLVITALVRWTPQALRRTGGILGICLSMGVAIASVHALVVNGKCATIEGVGERASPARVYWLDDDVMISMRYARNLAHGMGLVWNEGERVEGYTNFLWTLVLAIVHWAADDPKASLVVILLNTLILLLLLAASFRLALLLGASLPAATFAAVGLATFSGLIHWTSAGGEGPLVALFLVGMATSVLSPPVDPPPVPRWSSWFEGTTAAAWLGSLAVLTRPDALVPASVLLAFALMRRTDPGPGDGSAPARHQRLLKPLLVFVALPLLQILFRLLYYREWMPNTWFLKSTNWPGRSFAGLHYVQDLLSQHLLLLVLAGFSCIGSPGNRRRPAFLAVVLTLVYVALVGGDELPEQRFFVPVAPLVFVLAFTAFDRLAGDPHESRLATPPSGKPSAQPSARGAPLFALAATLAACGLGSAHLPGRFTDAQVRRSEGEAANVRIGYLLRLNTERDAKIAHFWAGAAAYFSQRPAIDLLGKCDRHVARLDARPNLMAPGHNKYDLDYSLSLEPDVLVSGLGGLAYRRKDEPITPYVADNLRTAYRAFGELQSNETFLALYLPNLVQKIDGWRGRSEQVSTHFHGIFVRTNSRRARPAATWSLPR